MIKIDKSANIPTVLTSKGIAERTALCTQYDGNPTAYSLKYDKKTNPHRLKFKASIYGDIEVKNQLISDQYEKCCFCEGTFLANAHGDVEHFRPKAGYKQIATDKIGKPGYYWLAYDWNNLMFSCAICNQIHKKNLFPINSGTTRALSHIYALEAVADCYLINPNEEDPETHIEFAQYVPKGRTTKGKNSITAYGLKRKRLNEARGKHLAEVRRNLALSVFTFSTITPAQIYGIKATLGNGATDLDVKAVLDSAQAYVNECAKKHSPFANMVRSNFPALPRV